VKTRLLALAVMLGVVAAAPSASAAESGDTPRGAFPISWTQCPDKPDVQCGTLRVPLDWARPRGEKITLALARHRATDPTHRIGALFINPGGPGGSAVEIATFADQVFSPELVSRFDIVGVDPRGIAGSTPVTCRPGPQPGYTLFPRAEAQFDQMVRQNRELGRSCLSRPAGCSATSTRSASPATMRRYGSDSASGPSTGWACPTAPRSAPTTHSCFPGGSGQWYSTARWTTAR
jgi:hypothetical protein